MSRGSAYDCKRKYCMLFGGWFFRGDGPTDSRTRVGNASGGLAMCSSDRSVLPTGKFIDTHALGFTGFSDIDEKNFGRDAQRERGARRLLRERCRGVPRCRFRLGPARVPVAGQGAGQRFIDDPARGIRFLKPLNGIESSKTHLGSIDTMVRATCFPLPEPEVPCALLGAQGSAEQCRQLQGRAAIDDTHELGEVFS